MYVHRFSYRLSVVLRVRFVNGFGRLAKRANRNTAATHAHQRPPVIPGYFLREVIRHVKGQDKDVVCFPFACVKQSVVPGFRDRGIERETKRYPEELAIFKDDRRSGPRRVAFG